MNRLRRLPTVIRLPRPTRWIRTGVLGLALAAMPATGALAETVPATTAEGFPVPQPGHRFDFPRDHGSHPAFKIEWWYLTGHLASDAGRRFGYQATFFRSALRPRAEQESDGSEADPGFGRDHLFLAHFALTDEEGRRFFHEERLNRNGWNATAAVTHLDVRNGNARLWAESGNPIPGPPVAEPPPPVPAPRSPTLRLQFTATAGAAADLTLVPAKPLVVFGEDGTSRKGPDPAARSYYLTWPRLATTGTVTLGQESFRVSGLTWMDHEIASQQLSEDLAGWDWTAIQMEDGWDVKAYVLRREDGTPSPFSALIWIDPDGVPHYRTAEDFRWERLEWWESPETGAAYPVEVAITTRHPRTDKVLTLRLEPVMKAQELSTGSAGFAYWEGACRVWTDADKPVGRAYLELVGYAGDATRGLR